MHARGSGSLTVQILDNSQNLNHPPIASNANGQVHANTNVNTNETLNINLNDYGSDSDGDPLTATPLTQPSHGSFTLISSDVPRKAHQRLQTRSRAVAL